MNTTIRVLLKFKPLNRGWFKCLQTNEKTKDCDKYRNSHKNLKVSEVKNANKITMRGFNTWNCPECNVMNMNGKLEENNICPYCGKVVYLYARSY
ncbi:MAG: hypothetical protein NTW62_02525 [Candidatus Nomurabacteria bacterium]|nr:hypothetical protein [Candidatus Nomurabacteria bacterium]